MIQSSLKNYNKNVIICLTKKKCVRLDGKTLYACLGQVERIILIYKRSNERGSLMKMLIFQFMLIDIYQVLLFSTQFLVKVDREYFCSIVLYTKRKKKELCVHLCQKFLVNVKRKGNYQERNIPSRSFSSSWSPFRPVNL